MNGSELAAILAAEPDAGHPVWARFDADFYRAANPDIGIAAGEDARQALLRHYLQLGRFQGLSPNPWFDEAWYLARHPEIASLVAAGTSVLGDGGIESGFEHYLLLGHAGLSPHWLFDEETYREQVSDAAIAAAGAANHYDHYLRTGARRGLAAHPSFDPGFYTAANAVPEHALPPTGAFGHYLARLWRDGAEGWTGARFDLVTARLDRATQAAIAERRARGALHHALLTGHIPYLPPDLLATMQAAWAVTATAAETSQGDASQAGTSPASSSDAQAPGGGLDIIGAHEEAGGWFVAGWLAHEPPETTAAAEPQAIAPATPILIATHHADGTLAAPATLAMFPRDDLAGRGQGFLAFIPSAEALAAGAIHRVDVITPHRSWRLPKPPGLQPTPAARLASDLAPLVARLAETPETATIRRRLAHSVADGGNTLPSLPGPILLEIDDALPLPGGDLVLVGWHLAPAGAVREIRLRHGWRTRPIRLDQGQVMERPDVRDSVGRDTGLGNLRCGFMLRVPGVFDTPDVPGAAPSRLCIEIETTSGAIGQRAVPLSTRSGMDAIRFLLDRIEPPLGNAAAPFDRVAGPAIAALQAQRMAEPVPVHRLDFGPPPTAPRITVIVTLYGRVDFLDFQLGIEAAQQLANQHPPGDNPADGHPAAAIERLYVLDDPPRARETQALAMQAHLRFALPFSLLMPDENRGFAGANNIGLRQANGRHVCFLNSDVFPGTPDWLARLADRLDADPTLGAVGPRLLYEDGSIQHDGMVFRRIPRIGAWRFPDHPGKGMRPDGATGLHRVPAATAACLMLRRDQALAIGGFDEAYPIGDFEDSDLCMKLRAMRLGIAVDRCVTLYHLERQSQAGSAEHWRMQLTLYNAWQHERRWQRLLDRPPLEWPEPA